MAFEDYRLNAQVRALLVRRCIDLGKIEHGATNGVIYIRGELRNFFDKPSEDRSRAIHDECALAKKLEQALRRIPGVRDVVFNLDRVAKVGPNWRPKR